MESKITQKLTRQEKQAIGILSIGTFLEYFDLMLYIHMAMLLNDLFFAKTDQFSASLLNAFAFSVTFVFRPIGALLIGWLGDKVGRKATVIVTSFAMAGSCLMMANLPTYEQIGITASWAVTICRIVQGMSSMGEIIGAELYLTETIKPPALYPAVGMMTIAVCIGVMVALLITNITLSEGFSWRIAFWFGTFIAVIGGFARTALREAPDFADAKKELINLGEDCNVSNIKEKIKASLIVSQKISIKTALALFSIQMIAPIVFYFVFIHCSTILKHKFGFTVAQIAGQSLSVSFFELIFTVLIVYLSLVINPLKILRTKYYMYFFFALASPFLLDQATNYFHILLIQIFTVILCPMECPASPIFYKAFPIFKRFTTVSFSFAMSRALMHVISSFGTVYLVDGFGNAGVLFLFVPAIIAYGFGLRHFFNLKNREDLEEQAEMEKCDRLNKQYRDKNAQYQPI